MLGPEFLGLLAWFGVPVDVLVQLVLPFFLQLRALLLVDEDTGVKRGSDGGERVSGVFELLLRVEAVDHLQLLFLHFGRSAGAALDLHHVVHLLHLSLFLVRVQLVPGEGNHQVVRQVLVWVHGFFLRGVELAESFTLQRLGCEGRVRRVGQTLER